MIAWVSNELHRRKIKQKAAKEEKKIMEKIKEKSQNPLIKNGSLAKLREKRLKELRLEKVKVDKTRTKDVRIKNNNFYKRTRETSIDRQEIQ